MIFGPTTKHASVDMKTESDAANYKQSCLIESVKTLDNDKPMAHPLLACGILE
jgi:hypothetical protein